MGSGWVRGAEDGAEPRLAPRVCRGGSLLSPFPPSDAAILLCRLKSHLHTAPVSSPALEGLRSQGGAITGSDGKARRDEDGTLVGQSLATEKALIFKKIFLQNIY